MKKKFYDVGTFIYLREQKRTTGLIIASAVAAVGALGASGINAASQSAANSTNMQLNKDTLEEQEKLFHEANQFNHDEAALARSFNSNESQIARDFNASQANLNREFQAGMLDKTIQQYENWNSASAQVQRYLDAGLNPATLAGNLQSGQGFGIPSGSTASASPASASPASSSSVPNLPVAHVNPVDYGSIFKEAIKTGFDTASNINSVRKGITENKFFGMQQEAGLELTRAQSNQICHQINLIDNEADLAAKKIDEVSASIRNLTSSADKMDVETQINEIKKLYANDFFNYQVKELEQKYKYTKGLAETVVALTYSKIAANYGAAAASYTQAELNKRLQALTDAERGQVEMATQFMDTQDKQAKFDLFLNKQFGWKDRFWQNENLKKGFDKLDYETSNTYRVIQGVKDCAVSAGAAAGAAYGTYKMSKGFGSQKNLIHGNKNFDFSGSYQY